MAIVASCSIVPSNRFRVDPSGTNAAKGNESRSDRIGRPPGGVQAAYRLGSRLPPCRPVAFGGCATHKLAGTLSSGPEFYAQARLETNQIRDDILNRRLDRGGMIMVVASGKPTSGLPVSQELLL